MFRALKVDCEFKMKSFDLNNEITEEAISEAKSIPNGWVYKIDGNFDKQDYVPPEAVVGARKVDENGKITGDFIPNPNYVSSAK